MIESLWKLSVCVRALNSWHCHVQTFLLTFEHKMSGMVGREVEVLMNIDISINQAKRQRRKRGRKGINFSFLHRIDPAQTVQTRELTSVELAAAAAVKRAQEVQTIALQCF